MIKRTLIFFILLFQVQVFSQTSSAYSRYGIGDIEYSYSARKLGMGQLGTAVSDIDFINTLNPAGWNKINSTRIEFGINYSGMTLSSKGLKKYYSDTQFSGFTLAFPISQLYGITMAAGIIPYSNVAYNVVQDYTSQPAGDYKISYTGSGGLSKLFVGTSYKLPFDLIIGATFDYYFGNLKYKSRAEFTEPGMEPAEYIRTFSPKGLGTTLGLISPDFSGIFGTKNISDLRFGISSNIFSTLSTDTTLVSNRNGTQDTIANAVVNLDIPARIHTGFSMTLSEVYLFTLDYAFQKWGNVTFNTLPGKNLTNSQKLSAGFEYRPVKSIGSTFWNLIMLRGGVTYEKTQYAIGGDLINFYGASAGFSIPLGPGNTLDFAVQYGVRGTEDFIKENIVRLSGGISLGDNWFVRQEK